MASNRDLERRLEAMFECGVFERVDFEELAYRELLARRSAKRQTYYDMRLYDPHSYRVLMAKHRAQREARPGYAPKREFTDRERREMRAMYEAGAAWKDIARAFHCSVATVAKALAESRAPRKPGDCERRAVGARNGKSKLTAEMVAKILSSQLGVRATARELGVSHRLVGDVLAGKSWIQKQGATQ